MKKNILFIIWSFSFGGGAEKILSNIVNGLDKKKYNISILEYYYVGIKKEKIDDNITLLPPIIDGTKNKFYVKFKRIIYEKILLYFMPNFVKKRYKKNKYDIEIAFNYLIPVFLLNRHGSKKICWFHGSIDNLKKDKINREFQRKALQNVDNIVAISEQTYHSIVDIYPEYKEKTSIIYNGFLFETIKKMSEAKINTNVKKIDLLFCGRLDDGKNPLKMIEILKILKRKSNNIVLGFLGDGYLLKKIKEKVKEYNLDENVIYFGYQQNPYPFIKSTKIMCMTSNAEGFPTVIIEGMTLGKPFISTPVAGIKEMSNNELCGFEVSNNDEFANKIYYILNNENLYHEMSQNCIEHVRKFSLDNQIRELEKLIKGDD